MADPRFHTNAGPLSLARIVELTGCELPDGADGAQEFTDVAPLTDAGPGDVSFLDNAKYVKQFAASSAGAGFVHPDRADQAPAEMVVLVTETPYLAYAKVASAFYPENRPEPGIHPNAVVDDGADVSAEAVIAAGAVVENGAVIGENSIIGPNTLVGHGVVIGSGCVIGANCVLRYCLIGNDVRIFGGATIGEAGFGFAQSDTGFLTVPQLGRVVIEDGVQIGANSTIDRGAGPDTIIGAGTRIDNLVQIGHNVQIGRNCIVVAQAGVAGSSILEDFVVLGGQAGVAGHLTLGKGAQLAAHAGLMKDIPAGERWVGAPAIPGRAFFRQVTALTRLAEQKVRKDG